MEQRASGREHPRFGRQMFGRNIAKMRPSRESGCWAGEVRHPNIPRKWFHCVNHFLIFEHKRAGLQNSNSQILEFPDPRIL